MSNLAINDWRRILPFALSYALVPLVFLGAALGGFWVLAIPFAAWYLTSAADGILGRDTENPDTDVDRALLFGYRLITICWAPVQFTVLIIMLWYVPQAAHLNGWEKTGLFLGIGVMTGTIGINYSHELMHQSGRMERAMADALLAMVLYSHFRSEHLLVHHRYVGTPRDAVTGRYGEGFYRFYMRILPECVHSAFTAEKEKLARKELPWTDKRNPFWLYWALQATMIILALLLGGFLGLALLLVQAGVAIFHLELVNYVEHYGLTRKYLGDGKYEPVAPRHSWNADHRVSNWLLINLQRHSDHHYKPARPYPLLQTYADREAPQLPYGYPIMTVMALIPSLWRKRMNPRVRRWRETYYPEITDWMPYNKATNPLPR